MTDLHKAEAAAREAVNRINAIPNAGMTNGEHALVHLIAALDAARGEAVECDCDWPLLGNCKSCAPPAAPRVERYGDGVLVHWPEGVEQYVCVGDCVTGNLGSLAVPEGYALVPVDLRLANDVWEAGIASRNGGGSVADMWAAMLAAARKGES